MASLNKVQIIGNLGKDPDTRYTTRGDAVCNISVATTDTWKDKNNQKQEKTEWHRVVLYRGMAETAQQYLKQGSQVYIEGRLVTEKWEDKNGEQRYTTKIEATDMKMLGRAPSRESVLEDRRPAAADRQDPFGSAPPVDDIPF